MLVIKLRPYLKTAYRVRSNKKTNIILLTPQSFLSLTYFIIKEAYVIYTRLLMRISDVKYRYLFVIVLFVTLMITLY